MAQGNNKPTSQQTAAQRDAQFIAEHPIEGRLVQAGAGFMGVVDAIGNSIDETGDLIKKTYTPGDQKNIRHPIDEIAAKAVKLKNGIAALVEPGDMNISNAPHPYDKAAAAIEKAGPIEGTRMSAAAAAGVINDFVGPGKLNRADHIWEAIEDASKLARTTRYADDVVTNSFLNTAVMHKQRQLVEAMEEYERTARSAQTFGEELGRHEGHGDALVKFQIASIKLDAHKHGGDATISNPVIADLTKNGINSSHFYSQETMNELKKFNPNQSVDYEQIASEMALDATKKAHHERLNFLQQLNKEQQPLSAQQSVELDVGKQYGSDAAANAREMMRNGKIQDVGKQYPDKPRDAHGNLMAEHGVDYLNVRSAKLENMSVADMRELGKKEIRYVEELVRIKQDELAYKLPAGTERRASQGHISGVTYTSEAEYLLAKSGEGKRAGDASIQKFSEQNTYEQYQIWESMRNKGVLELRAGRGGHFQLELKQYQDALEYMKLRQALLESKSLDNNAAAMREVFRNEHHPQQESQLPDSGTQKIKPGNDRVSLNDAINHLENTVAQGIVLARIQEQSALANQIHAGQEFG